jgi:hypothetical protein
VREMTTGNLGCSTAAVTVREMTTGLCRPPVNLASCTTHAVTVRDNCTSVRVAVKRGSVVAQDTASDVGHLRCWSEAQLRCGTNVLCSISVMCRISV